jgi:hypothetical protein
MANKTINFVIKVNNKEVDLSKTSFKQFDDIIKQAKKDLQGLPLSDPRYKVLVTDIKTAESAWKAAQASAADLGDEMDKGEEKTKSYKAQILELTKANIALKNSGQGSSQAFADNEAKIKALKDEQEAMTRSTQKLDDALSNIPGPIGQIGQGMQQLENISQSAKSAFKSLGLGVETFGQALKTSGVGAIVLLIVALAAAVMDAAKKSQPLQDAFAAIGDAVGALFDALKPITDFLINVFVGAVKLVAGALNGLASLFGGVNKGFKQQSLELERTINRDKAILDNYGNFINEYYKKLLDIQTKYAEKRKAVLDDDKITDEQRKRELARLNALETADKNIAEKERERSLDLHNKNIDKLKKDNAIKGLDNARKESIQSIENQKQFDSDLEEQNRKASQNRQHEMKALMNNLIQIRATGTEEEKKSARETLALLRESFLEEYKIQKRSNEIRRTQEESANAEIGKIKRAAYREDVSLVKERSLAVMDAATSLIKEENARALQGAKDKLETLKESQRKEIEATKLAGQTLKGLNEKQAAERKVANEEVRKAQIQYDAYLIDLEINKQNRLLTEATIGTKEYFDAREAIITKSLEKEFILADGNADKIYTARTKQWKEILDLDKEKLQVQLDLYQKEQDGLYEGTIAYFNKQREIETKRFDLEQLTYQQNYSMLEASKAAHEKNMTAIDVAQIRATADLIERRAATEQKLIGKHYDDLRLAEELKYQTDLKMAGDNALAKETLLKEHNQRVREINNQQIQDYAAVATAMLDMLSNVGSSIAALYEVESQDTKKTMKEREAAFEKNKQYQKATAYLSAASGIIQILTQPSTLPSPFDWIVKIGNAAALGIMTAAQIKKIDATQFSGTSGGSGGGSGSGGSCMGKNYGDGGMIEGPLHSSSQGGVPIMAEGGEAVMTRGAVTMFRPLLSMMNQAGGGTSFTKGAIGQASFDNPKTENNPMQEPIIKTYVVESELTTIQHKQARLKDLSTL